MRPTWVETTITPQTGLVGLLKKLAPHKNAPIDYHNDFDGETKESTQLQTEQQAQAQEDQQQTSNEEEDKQHELGAKSGFSSKQPKLPKAKKCEVWLETNRKKKHRHSRPKKHHHHHGEKGKKRGSSAKGQRGQMAKVRKPHRYRPGTVALREIRRYQKSTHRLIPRANFERLINEILQGIQPGFRWKKLAKVCLHEATEAMVVDLMQKTNRLAIHCKRVTIKSDDIHLANTLEQNA